MPAQEIIDISKLFSSVTFVDNGFNTTSEIYKESIILLNVLRHKTAVFGYEFATSKTFLDKDVTTRPDGPVLWVFGCSHGHGVGLKEHEETFGQIVANSMQLPLMKITKPGSSLNWSFRHLINANIRPGDRVIWQITTTGRLSLNDGKKVTEVLLAHTKNRSLLDVNNDDQLFFNQICLLNAGICYLRGIHSQFLFLDIVDRRHDLREYILEYAKHPEYCYKPNIYIDLGTDGLHAGPLSHNAIALSLLSRV